MSQRFDRHGRPIPPSREERMRSWLTLLVVPAGIVLATMGGLLLLWEWRATLTTPASWESSPPAAASSPSPGDKSLRAIAAAMQTMAAPTPTNTPTPTPEPTPYRTPKPEQPLCGMTARFGEACQWPPPTPLPPTPLPMCVTPSPGDECLWRGRVTPTPVAVPWPANVVGA